MKVARAGLGSRVLCVSRVRDWKPSINRGAVSPEHVLCRTRQTVSFSTWLWDRWRDIPLGQRSLPLLLSLG